MQRLLKANISKLFCKFDFAAQGSNCNKHLTLNMLDILLNQFINELTSESSCSSSAFSFCDLR